MIISKTPSFVPFAHYAHTDMQGHPLLIFPYSAKHMAWAESLCHYHKIQIVLKMDLQFLSIMSRKSIKSFFTEVSQVTLSATLLNTHVIAM